MGNNRILLYFTLFFVSYLIWAQWQLAYGPKSAVTAQKQQTVKQTKIEQEPASGIIPQAGVIPQAIEGKKHPVASMPNNRIKAQSPSIHVKTDVMDVQVDTRGGDIKELKLLKYLQTAKKNSNKVQLLTENPDNYQIVQSGLVAAKQQGPVPSHNALFRADKLNYELAEGENKIEVPLYWKNKDGLTVKKVLTFTRNSYVIDVTYYITAGEKKFIGSDYMQILRRPPVKEKGHKFSRTYTGGILYNEKIKYKKESFSSLEEKNINEKLANGWLAMIDHYFVTAWIPEPGNNNLYYSRYIKSKDEYVLGVRSAAHVAQPGKTIEIKNRLVASPKLQYELAKIEPGLDLTVDYGILTIIAKPLFWLLNFFHTLTGNWGWAIILLTISVKLAFYKLSEMSYRSMAKMRLVAPRMKQMKERFGKDRQAMSKAMMEMYKQEKINPMGGCLPILVQMPVFLALYWVLLGSAEMRHAPFIFWITNLTGKDPYFVLPVLMGISMFFQQKLNPAPVDPIQQKVFQVMPFAFTFMFAFFPSGLVLYWVVNNILSIAQQYLITRQIERAR